MSSIYHSGYGYSKIICEDVTSWFLNNFFPRHKISVDIIHRGLKKEQVLGYCDVVGENYRPRHFMIELQTDMDKETIERRLKNALNQIPTAIGMNNHQGSKASADQHVMTNVAKVLKNKNLFYIDSRTTVETIGETTMEVFGVPTARRNIFLDNDDDEEKIVKQLQKLAKKAEKSGYAIGIGHVKPKTLFVLEEQIPILKRQGFKFEFVSRMLH